MTVTDYGLMIDQNIDDAFLTWMFHTQLLWYRAECSLLAFFTSATSQTYTLWSVYTQLSRCPLGSKVSARVSGCAASEPAGGGLL